MQRALSIFKVSRRKVIFSVAKKCVSKCNTTSKSYHSRIMQKNKYIVFIFINIFLIKQDYYGGYLFHNQMANIELNGNYSSDMNTVAGPFVYKRRVGVGMEPLKGIQIERNLTLKVFIFRCLVLYIWVHDRNSFISFCFNFFYPEFWG